MITDEQVREALQHVADEETQPLGDEVPSPEPPARGNRSWADYHHSAICWLKGVQYRRNGQILLQFLAEIRKPPAG